MLPPADPVPDLEIELSLTTGGWGDSYLYKYVQD